MGRALQKHWNAAGDLLCVRDDLAAEGENSDCREVWIAGNKVELRRPGGDTFPKEGILRRAVQ